MNEAGSYTYNQYITLHKRLTFIPNGTVVYIEGSRLDIDKFKTIDAELDDLYSKQLKAFLKTKNYNVQYRTMSSAPTLKPSTSHQSDVPDYAKKEWITDIDLILKKLQELFVFEYNSGTNHNLITVRNLEAYAKVNPAHYATMTDATNEIRFETIELLMKQLGYKISTAELRRLSRSQAVSTEINNVSILRRYYDSLRKTELNGVSPIQIMLDALALQCPAHELPEYTRIVHHYMRKWIVCSVAQIMGRAINWVVPVLISDEDKKGIGKSRWTSFLTFRLQRIPPHPMLKTSKFLDRNSADTHKSQKMKRYLTENCFLVIDEMQQITPANFKDFCAQLTSPYLDVGIERSSRPRTANVIGSANTESFTIPKLERRFFPFQIQAISDTYLHLITEDMLYAEAVQLFNDGFDYVWSNEEIEYLLKASEKFVNREKAQAAAWLQTKLKEAHEPTRENRYGLTELHKSLQKLYKAEYTAHIRSARMLGEVIREIGITPRRLNLGNVVYVQLN